MSDDVVTIPTQEGPYRIPKSIIDAVSDIQQYAVMESEGISDIPEGYLTLRRSMAYVSIGFSYGLGDNVLLWVISPFVYAVIFNLFPIFGHKHLTLIDKVFAFILSKYITIGLLSLMIFCCLRPKGHFPGDALPLWFQDMRQHLCCECLFSCLFIAISIQYGLIFAPGFTIWAINSAVFSQV